MGLKIIISLYFVNSSKLLYFIEFYLNYWEASLTIEGNQERKCLVHI